MGVIGLVPDTAALGQMPGDEPWICPSCHAPSGGSPRCKIHGLYVVPPSEPSLGSAPLLGQVLGKRYILIGVLGDGGMGAVYRGFDARLSRDIAIKVLTGVHAMAEGVRERFEQEALALSRLRGEHTVTVYDYGVADAPGISGIPYIAMELLTGESLATRIAKGPLPPAEVAQILSDVAKSLSEAHAAGIIHRDVKPSNILTTQTPEGTQVAKVIDFGIARLGDGTRRTRTGVLMGTPQYMAPEQCANKIGKISEKTDLYALAIVAYEMLTGIVPFDGEPMAVIYDQVNTAVPHLPGRPSGLRDSLDAVIRRALAKIPKDRFDSVTAFTNAFVASVEGAPDAMEPLVLPQEVGAGRPDAITAADAPQTEFIVLKKRPRGWLIALSTTVILWGLMFVLWPHADDKPEPAPGLESVVTDPVTLAPIVAESVVVPQSTVQIDDAGAPDAQPPDARSRRQPKKSRPRARPKKKPKTGVKPSDNGLLLEAVPMKDPE